MNTTAEVYLWGTRIGIIHQENIIIKNENTIESGENRIRIKGEVTCLDCFERKRKK